MGRKGEQRKKKSERRGIRNGRESGKILSKRDNRKEAQHRLFEGLRKK